MHWTLLLLCGLALLGLAGLALTLCGRLGESLRGLVLRARAHNRVDGEEPDRVLADLDRRQEAIQSRLFTARDRALRDDHHRATSHSCHHIDRELDLHRRFRQAVEEAGEESGAPSQPL